VEFHPVDFLAFSEALAVNTSLESLAIEFSFFEAKGRGSVDSALRSHKACQGLYFGEAFKVDAGGPSREALIDLLVALVNMHTSNESEEPHPDLRTLPRSCKDTTAATAIVDALQKNETLEKVSVVAQIYEKYGNVSSCETTYFLKPYHPPFLASAEEALAKMDKDNDGQVSLDEFLEEVTRFGYSTAEATALYNEMAGEDGVLTAEDWATSKQGAMDAKTVLKDYGPTRFLPTPLNERLTQMSPFPARRPEEMVMHSCVFFRAGLDVTAKPLPGRAIEPEIGKDRRTMEEIGWRNMPVKPWRSQTLRRELRPRYDEESTVDGGSSVPTPRVAPTKVPSKEDRRRKSLRRSTSGPSGTGNLTNPSRIGSLSRATLAAAEVRSK
jgi:hypothetical protein